MTFLSQNFQRHLPKNATVGCWDAGCSVEEGRLKSLFSAWEEIRSPSSVLSVIKEGYKLLLLTCHQGSRGSQCCQLYFNRPQSTMGSEPFNCVHLSRGEEISCARLKTRKSSSFQVQIPMQRHKFCSTTVRGRILPVYIRHQKYLSSCWNFDSHRIYLGFQWPFQGKPSHFVFNVLLFLMSIAPYILAKVLKPVINYWRSAGRRICMFLGDRLGGNFCRALPPQVP